MFFITLLFWGGHFSFGGSGVDSFLHQRVSTAVFGA